MEAFNLQIRDSWHNKAFNLNKLLFAYRFGSASSFGRWIGFSVCQNFFVEKSETSLIPHRTLARGNCDKVQRTIYQSVSKQFNIATRRHAPIGRNSLSAYMKLFQI